MLIKKGQLIKIKHSRHGTFSAQAIEDFDTEKAEFWPIITKEYVDGATVEWVPEEPISCRGSFVIDYVLHD